MLVWLLLFIVKKSISEYVRIEYENNLTVFEKHNMIDMVENADFIHFFLTFFSHLPALHVAD